MCPFTNVLQGLQEALGAVPELQVPACIEAGAQQDLEGHDPMLVTWVTTHMVPHFLATAACDGNPQVLEEDAVPLSSPLTSPG